MTRNGDRVAGLVLAAGGGRRLGGRPKALLPHRGRPLVEHAVKVLRAAGVTRVHVVLGAAADTVRAQARLDGCVVVENAGWEDGMGSSLRAGLDSLTLPVSPSPSPSPSPSSTEASGVGGVLVLLVDQPGIGVEAVGRVLGAYEGEESLVSAAYGGVRGHPVLFGAAHWAGVAATANGDQGARGYLRSREGAITLVECGDVAEPYDIDTEADLARLE